MRRLELYDSLNLYAPEYDLLNDESIAIIASCVDKIEELAFNADDVTMHGWEILSTAITNRPTAVS